MEKYEELLISLRRIIRSIDLHSKKLNKTSGMTGPQLLVLQEVHKEQGITAKRIAENVNLSQGTITTILDKLESRDLVSRIRSETDRRRVSLFLTDKGSQLLEKAPKPMQEDFIEKFKSLANFPNSTLINIDGIRIEFENGWGLLRASNTTPNLVLRFEANNQENLENISNDFREILSKIDSDLAHFQL